MGRSLVSLRRRRGRGEEAGVGELDRGVLCVCAYGPPGTEVLCGTQG